MSQIFHPAFNTLARAGLFGGLLLAVGALFVGREILRSPWQTEQGVVRDQPVPFSHKHHVGGLGIDCRYCHAGVEEGPFAGLPATEVCMKCHAQIWPDSPMLEPVRRSWAEGKPLVWSRVHRLADFAYFDHSIHVKKGVGCETCHGRVDRMPLTWKQESLFMEWCLDCHRDPGRRLRPPSEVTTVGWTPPAAAGNLAEGLVRDLDIRPRTDCADCHR